MRSSSSGLFPKYLLSEYIYYLAVFVVLTTGSPHNVAQCCRRHNIPEVCVDTLCNPSRPPSDINIYGVFEKPHNCHIYLERISQCLTDGRNHTHCCILNAKDSEESACLGMCEGNVSFNDASWGKYQTCLAVNVPSMFKCYSRGYDIIPSQPNAVQVIIANAETVKVTWTAPVFNPRLAFNYMVVIEERDGHKKTEVLSTATSTFVEGLVGDTRYTALVYSLAIDGKQRSLSSDIQMFQTPGDPPKVSAYREEVRVTRSDKTAVIACVIYTSGTRKTEPTVQWLRKVGKKYVPVTNYRFNITMYSANFKKPKEHISMIDISRIEPEDAGFYRCSATNGYGSSSADVELKVHVNPAAVGRPADPPIECCKRLGVKEGCLPMCGVPVVPVKPRKSRPAMPLNCSVEIDKVMQCSMSYQVDDSNCCLRNGLPRECMYLCHHNERMISFMPFICTYHVRPIEECRLEGEERRPTAVSYVEANVARPGEQAVVRWATSDKADGYQIYWRTSPYEAWSVRTISGNTKKLTPGATEVAIVAVNGRGSSQPVFLSLVEGAWMRM